MTILWIPHSPQDPGAVRRDQHLIRHLKDRHRIISVTWETRSGPLSLKAFWNGLRRYPITLDDGRTACHVRRIPDMLRPFRKDRFQAMGLNQRLFRNDIRRIIREEKVDLVITAFSSFMTGLPPFEIDVPVVFDYLDCADWKANPQCPEVPYLKKSDAVLAVSELAVERANQYNQYVKFLPNGADVPRFRNALGEEVRAHHGLSSAKVVSLIGLTTSPRLYFLEAVQRAKQQIPELKCLLVGRSDAVKRALNELPGAEGTFIYVGPVPYDEVASYFAASDVGLYPVEGNTYDSGRSPIKIFEYTAAGVPVVVPRMGEASRIGFKNLYFADPDANAFATQIIEAINGGREGDPTVERYDWKNLAAKLDQYLEILLAHYQRDDNLLISI